MADALIENPILNSPFHEPERHFKFTDEGITNEIVQGRRSSSYFIPIARPKKKGKQLAFDTEWTQDRIEENKTVNRIRQRVGMWRDGGYVGVTPTTAALLRYWTDPERERKLFFCQVEALETIAEVLTGDDRKEAEKREEEARIWISGIEAVKAKIGVKAIYDLSATPFFLRGSGYPEGTLFPWVVSDFSLIDAIEAGIVKVPRVPVADDSMQGDQPTYRDLWLRIREHLPKKGTQDRGARRRAEAARRAGRGASKPLRQLREVLPSSGRRTPTPRPRGSRRPSSSSSATTPTSRSWSSITSPAGRKPIADGRPIVVPGPTAALQQRARRRLEPAAQHDPGRQRAARIGRRR